MKREKMARIIGLVDEKFVEEAAPRRKRRGRKPLALALVAAVLTLAILGGALFLFVPYSDKSPIIDIDKYRDSEYYPLIEAMYNITIQNAFTLNLPMNNFDRIFAQVKNTMAPTDDLLYGVEEDTAGSNDTPGYVETTDNQVEGVIEGDRIKRSTTHIFYLGVETIYIYEILGEQTSLVSSLKLTASEGKMILDDGLEFYLSEDCSRLTVVAPMWDVNSKRSKCSVDIISIDVSNPAEPKEAQRVSISGQYVSSRLVDGCVMVVTNFVVYGEPDFSVESEFIPQITTDDEERSIAMEDIFLPEADAQNATYTVIVMLDESDLSIDDELALFSYSKELYVSQDKIFASMGYVDVIETDIDVDSSTKKTTRKVVNKTEIAVISYDNSGFETLGSISIDGTVLNQYSMDEHDNILRVVSTTNETYSEKEIFSGGGESSIVTGRKKNTSLYCVELDNFSVIASVEGFAPEGEEVTSVRFNGDICYVCTADTKFYRDPVYFFDLSDVNNITYTDTGDIEGYSSSLVDMGEGLLLGIGYVDSLDSLKLELYVEEGEAVRGIASMEKFSVAYSDNYKAYFIDREHDLIGLAIYDYKKQNSFYNLYGFDGSGFVELCSVDIEGTELDICRGTIIDGVLYVLFEDKLYTQMIFGE